MAKNTFNAYVQACLQARFLLLLVLLLLLILITPFLEDFFQTRILNDIFLTAIFIWIIYTIKLKKAQTLIAVILVLPLIISTWASYMVGLASVGMATRIFGALFFAYAVINILRIIYKTKEITRETIYAAIVAYLLLALMWAFIYAILETAIPGSFDLPEQGFRGEYIQFEYFSFITITTLGYGDIIPLTDKASALAICEAVIGQIYLVVLVAWLVGMHVSRRSR
jgi:voltage-gated potassium channel